MVVLVICNEALYLDFALYENFKIVGTQPDLDIQELKLNR